MSAAEARDGATSLETPELHCPRCGYNLRGLPQPRCPECGLGFKWAELIDAMHSGANSPLFEYQWRRRPVRSFLLTVGRAMLPWRLWPNVRITWEPRIGPLLALALLTILLWGACSVGAEFVSSRYPLRLLDFAGQACEAVGFVLWSVMTWLSLQIYQQTIGRYRIRQRQLLRVVALALVGLMCWLALARLAAEALSILYDYGFSSLLSYRRTLRPLITVIDVLPWCVFTLSLCLALSGYLRIRRGWLMGLATVAIMILTLWVALSVAIVLSGSPASTWTGILWSLWQQFYLASGRLFFWRISGT